MLRTLILSTLIAAAAAQSDSASESVQASTTEAATEGIQTLLSSTSTAAATNTDTGQPVPPVLNGTVPSNSTIDGNSTITGNGTESNTTALPAVNPLASGYPGVSANVAGVNWTFPTTGSYWAYNKSNSNLLQQVGKFAGFFMYPPELNKTVRVEVYNANDEEQVGYTSYDLTPLNWMPNMTVMRIDPKDWPANLAYVPLQPGRLWSEGVEKTKMDGYYAALIAHAGTANATLIGVSELFHLNNTGVADPTMPRDPYALNGGGSNGAGSVVPSITGAAIAVAVVAAVCAL